MSNKKIKLVVGYIPFESKKGAALLSQNRQFQYFNAKTYIYPMVPAYAASNAQKHGYEVKWMDGIAEEKRLKEWFAELVEFNPDFILLEVKSPVMEQYWRAVNTLKKVLPETNVVMVGDQITFLPQETMAKCAVDYLITGGDYDFVIVNLMNHITRGEKLESGVWWRPGDKNIKFDKPEKFKTETGEIFLNSGKPSLAHNLDTLPFVDRDLTKYKLYAFYNGNFKYHPGTYMYSGRDCWWNRCTFCVWDHTLNPIGSYRSFSAQRLFDEVKHVVDNYGIKEIFDDAGTFMVSRKLRDFCNLMIESGYNKKVVFGCNMRLNALRQKEYDLMGKANFRFILYGMESGNQKTLDKLDKGVNVPQIEEGVRMAKKAGLEPHLTVMLGYPWETYEDALRTIDLAKHCFDKGYVDTLQATITIPYPGTPLWKECKEKGWLLTERYQDYDMRQPVMKTDLTQAQIMELTQKLYSSFLTPRFILRKILSIKSFQDIEYLFLAGWRFLGHLKDFSPKQLKT